MKILVLVAHPDDEIIMCGATIDKLVQKKHQVHVTYYTKNDQAFFNNETQDQRRKRAQQEAIKASQILNYQTNFLNFEDMHVIKDEGLLLKETIHEIRRVKPDIILTHNDIDKHIDHRTIGRVVAEANFQSGCDLLGGKNVWSAQTVLQGEIDLESTTPFRFEIISEVSEENLKRKIKAYQAYLSVSGEHKTEKSWLVKRFQMLASLRGQTVGSYYGEAFILNDYAPLKSSNLVTIAKLLES